MPILSAGNFKVRSYHAFLLYRSKCYPDDSNLYHDPSKRVVPTTNIAVFGDYGNIHISLERTFILHKESAYRGNNFTQFNVNLCEFDLWPAWS